MILFSRLIACVASRFVVVAPLDVSIACCPSYRAPQNTTVRHDNVDKTTRTFPFRFLLLVRYDSMMSFQYEYQYRIFHPGDSRKPPRTTHEGYAEVPVLYRLIHSGR